VLATGRSFRLSRLSREADTGLLPSSLSRLVVPLKLGERVIGVLGTDSFQENAFGEADERLLVTISGQLAVAIEKVRLYQDAVRVAERRAVVYRAAQEISASLDLEQVYAAIHRAVAQLMVGEEVMIALLGESRHEIECVYLAERGRRLPPTKYPADRGFSGRIIATGKPVRVDDAELKMNDIDEPNYGLGKARSLVAVPPPLKGQVIGSGTFGSTYYVTREVLRTSGLDPDKDIKWLPVGQTPERLQLLSKGLIAATPLSPPDSILAKKMGFKELVRSSPLVELTPESNN
jgi:GAF domain-containing protein